MNKNQNIKQGYRQSEIGILPQDWEVVRLGEVCFVQSGGTPSKNEKSYWENGTIKWLGSSVCKNLHYVDEITDYITDKGLQNSSAKIFKQGTTLIALVGATIGKIAYLNFDASTNQNIAGIYPQNEKVLNHIFLFYVSLILYKEFEKLSSDKFKMANLSFVKSLQIPLPPLKEQEKIARILGAWDNAIATLDSLITAKQRYKKALMQRLLTPPCESPTLAHGDSFESSPSLAEGDKGGGSLRGSVSVANRALQSTKTQMDCHESRCDSRNDDKSVDCHESATFDKSADFRNGESLRFGGFSDKWQEFRLGDICKITTGSLNANAMVENGEFAFFTCAREVYAIDNYAFDTEALLISGNGANVGYIHYYNGKFNAYQRTYVLDKFVCDILFIKFFLDKNLKKRIAQEKNEGNTPYIVLSTLQNMKILLPQSLAEQKKIAQVLSVCDKEIAILDSKLQCLKTQKRGLMQQLLSGNVRVKC